MPAFATLDTQFLYKNIYSGRTTTFHPLFPQISKMKESNYNINNTILFDL